MVSSLENILKGFRNKKILVIGDLMLDRYVYGEMNRLSPEAPVPIITFKNEEFKIGGAGNVASNVSSLGGKTYFFSFIGRDYESKILKKLLSESNINYHLNENEITTVKERVIARSQQVLRIDREETSEKIFLDKTKEYILQKAEECDILIISDYAKGVVTCDLMNLLKNYTNKMIVDPKPSNPSLKKDPLLYKGVLLMTPNEKESFALSGYQDVYKAGKRLKKKFDSDIVITRAEKGMILFYKDSNRSMELPSYADKKSDITGAGDTMIAAFSLALASGASLEEASLIASNAAAISIERYGTYSVKLEELEKRIFRETSKIVNFSQLEEIVKREREFGKTIVWTNGCFDIYTIGHKNLLEEAAKEGHILIVGIDSDESVRRLKGENRPINNERSRAEIISSIENVDYVTIFPENGLIKYLEVLQPDIYVKGGDYTIETINQEERRLVESYGGKVKIVGRDMRHHVTSTIERIKNLK